MLEPVNKCPPEHMQVVIDALALGQIVDLCFMSPEGAAIVEDLRAKIMVKQISYNIKPTPDDVVRYLQEKYKDGPEGPSKAI